MEFFGMLFSGAIGFLIGMICKTIIDFKVLCNMRRQLLAMEADNAGAADVDTDNIDTNIEVIEIRDNRSVNTADYFKPF